MSDRVASKPLSGPIEYDFGDSTPEAWPKLYIAKDDHIAEKLRYARALTQICSYCGWEAKAGGGSWSELQAHIHACPDHPVGKLTKALSTLFAACDAPVIHHPKLGAQWLAPAMEIARAALTQADGDSKS